MFDILPASSAGADSGPGHAMLSVAVHAVLIGAAILWTTESGLTPTREPPIDPMVFFPILLAAPAVPAPSTSTSGAALLPGPIDAATISPVGLPSALALTAGVPTAGVTTDPSASPGIGTPGWLGGPASGVPWTAMEVDDPARVLEAGRLQYPVVLERAGVTGSVVLEFVVDTLGRVEPASVRVVTASHPGFQTAALDAVLATRFRAARARGLPVRQLVQQRLSFVAREP